VGTKSPHRSAEALSSSSSLEIMSTGIRSSGSILRTVLGQAREFVEDDGSTFPLRYDGSFQSRIELGVSFQPTPVLFTADGATITGWIDRFTEDAILELITQSTGR
jgi:hypothetical protein